MSQGVVAAGHPLTAEAGAAVLREGGNAVDAAVCAVLASFAVESPLTGFGAGGFMLVHADGGRPGPDRLLRRGPGPRRDRAAAPSWSRSPSTSTPRRSRRSTSAPPPAACRAPRRGSSRRCERHGSAPLADLVGPGVRLAREGAPVNAEQAYILDILAPIHERLEGTRELYAPRGRPLREGDEFRFPELAEALERFGAEGAEPFYRGEVAAAIGEFVLEQGGTLGPGDLAAYEAIARAPIRVPFRGTEVLTNPPPSSGGILIAYCLGAAGADGGEQRARAAGRGDGRRQRRARRGLRRGAARRGPRREPARPGRARPAPPPTCSARPPTSRCSTPTGCARA